MEIKSFISIIRLKSMHTHTHSIFWYPCWVELFFILGCRFWSCKANTATENAVWSRRVLLWVSTVIYLTERSTSKFHRFILCTVCLRANAFSHKTTSTNTTSRNASLAKHRCAYASYAAITLLHYLPSRSRTATSEFGHGLFIKTEHTFQQPTLPYTTRRCAITITTFLNNSLSRWIEIKRAVRWDHDSAVTTWVKLLLCICMFYDNKKASCAKLFCC